MRLLLAATTLAAATTLPAPAAAHHGTIVIRCVVSFSADGPSSGNGSCVATGTVHGILLSGTPAWITFTTASASCPLTRTALGQLTIDSSPATSLAVAISRVGPAGTVTTTGDLQGRGAATFVPLVPGGYACSGPATEYWRLAVTS